MRTRHTTATRLVCIFVLLSAALASGCTALSTSGESVATSPGGVVSPDAGPEVKSDAGLAVGSATSPGARVGVESVAAPAQDTLVISTAGMNLEVKNLDTSVAAIRTLAAKYSATISNLSTNAGSDPTPPPQPLADLPAGYGAPTPGGAVITLRIPAEKLPLAQDEIAGLGRVTSQTSTQDDVTQQHVDLKARLKNLQAEEMRLRTFFLKAKRVSEMLAIEEQLTRVRGEIEAMQAQISYLERQAAMATLTISLTEPGALVSPTVGGWGFADAVREGIRAAAGVVRSMITALLAFSPLIVLGVVLYVTVRALVRRRKRPRAHADAPDEPVPTVD